MKKYKRWIKKEDIEAAGIDLISMVKKFDLRFAKIPFTHNGWLHCEIIDEDANGSYAEFLFALNEMEIFNTNRRPEGAKFISVRSMNKKRGRRAENKVKDWLVKNEFNAKRVPVSGAAKDFPGDVTVELNGDTIVLEVKSTTGERSITIRKAVFDDLNCGKKDIVILVPGWGNSVFGLITEPNILDLINLWEKDGRLNDE
jgi:hypothetical protein